MAVVVNLYVTDDTVSHLPIQGAVVTIVDPITYALDAQATTDVNGLAAFTLAGAAYPTGQAYQVRVYKQGVFFANPFQILVFEPAQAPPNDNGFTLTGTIVNTLSPATDPRCCRCTGRFLDFQNQPVANAVVRIIARANIEAPLPKVVDGNMISPQVLEVHTDADGYVVIDLLRTGVYEVNFAGNDDVVWMIQVPDRSSVNLIDLIHPQPVALTWDPTQAPSNAATISIAGTQAEPYSIPYTVLFSDFESVTHGENGSLLQYLTFSNSDGTKALVAAGDGIIYVSGLAVGTCNVTVGVQPNLLPYRVPAYSISAPTLVLTVVP
jgi:hypothetical protein